ncbi:hypothetical protein DC522_07090 [Microvirga sp. KLBC 81]|nr:hypothetical protein DC522_07090 [Microvirga sp. KLBC 81]
MPFTSHEETLILLRRIYPNTSLDKEGFGYLEPIALMGELQFSPDDNLTFHLAYIERPDVQELCRALDLTALDCQTLELIHPV